MSIAIENLSVDFLTEQGAVHALRNVSIKTEQGKIVAIVGEGTIYQQKLSNGIPDAIIIKVFHKDTNKVIDYVYPFTRKRKTNSEGFEIDVKQGLRFVSE